MISKFIHTWNTFWFRSAPPHSMAVFRILFGIFFYIYSATFLVNVPMFFSDQGLILPLLVDHVPSWLQFVTVLPPVWVSYVLCTIFMLALTGFTFGYRFKLSTFLMIVIAYYFWQLSLHMFITSYNRILFLCLLVFLFSGADKTYSLWAKKYLGSYMAWQPICILPQRLITVQVTITYLGVGWQKWILPMWQDGKVLKYAFQTLWATPLGFKVIQLGLPDVVYDFFVFIIKVWESAVPFGFWHKKTRIFWIVTAWMFHLGIAVLMSIWWFVFLFALYHLFWEPEEFYTYLKKKGRAV